MHKNILTKNSGGSAVHAQMSNLLYIAHRSFLSVCYFSVRLSSVLLHWWVIDDTRAQPLNIHMTSAKDAYMQKYKFVHLDVVPSHGFPVSVCLRWQWVGRHCGTHKCTDTHTNITPLSPSLSPYGLGAQYILGCCSKLRRISCMIFHFFIFFFK